MSAARQIRDALVRTITETIDDCPVFDGAPAVDQPPAEAVWIERKYTSRFETRSLGGQPWNRDEFHDFTIKVAAYREGRSHAEAQQVAADRVDALVHRIEWDAVGGNQTLFDACTDARVSAAETDDTPTQSGWEVHCDLTVTTRHLPAITGP